MIVAIPEQMMAGTNEKPIANIAQCAITLA
jgi:hypothetical protein